MDICRSLKVIANLKSSPKDLVYPLPLIADELWQDEGGSATDRSVIARAEIRRRIQAAFDALPLARVASVAVANTHQPTYATIRDATIQHYRLPVMYRPLRYSLWLHVWTGDDTPVLSPSARRPGDAKPSFDVVQRTLGQQPVMLVDMSNRMSGSFGVVRPGFIDGMPSVFKEVIESDDDHAATASPNHALQREVLLQRELFCRTRGWRRAHDMAAVAKLSYVVKRSDMPSHANMMMCMENLQELPFATLPPPVFFRTVLRIARLLQYLQNRYRFMHRDLHAQNIMMRTSVRRVGGVKVSLAMAASPSPQHVTDVHPVLIDFGEADATFDACTRIIASPALSIYSPRDSHREFNPSHDLRTLLMSLCEFIPDKDVNWSKTCQRARVRMCQQAHPDVRKWVESVCNNALRSLVVHGAFTTAMHANPVRHVAHAMYQHALPHVTQELCPHVVIPAIERMGYHDAAAAAH